MGCVGPEWTCRREAKAASESGTHAAHVRWQAGLSRRVGIPQSTRRPAASAVGIKLFEGDSRGRWEGDTLVVDVTNQNDKTWFDMARNFHSDAIHAVERFTPADANTIQYEATIDDPKKYTRPWKLAFPITRILRPGYEIMELACVEGERDLQHYTEGEGGKKDK
jgi:hypothetical protein